MRITPFLVMTTLLSGCAAQTPKVINDPPLVSSCKQSPAEQIAPIPDLPGIDAWIADLMRQYGDEVSKRRAEDGCLNDLAIKGIIR